MPGGGQTPKANLLGGQTAEFGDGGGGFGKTKAAKKLEDSARQSVASSRRGNRRNAMLNMINVGNLEQKRFGNESNDSQKGVGTGMDDAYFISNKFFDKVFDDIKRKLDRHKESIFAKI